MTQGKKIDKVKRKIKQVWQIFTAWGIWAKGIQEVFVPFLQLFIKSEIMLKGLKKVKERQLHEDKDFDFLCSLKCL